MVVCLSSICAKRKQVQNFVKSSDNSSIKNYPGAARQLVDKVFTSVPIPSTHRNPSAVGAKQDRNRRILVIGLAKMMSSGVSESCLKNNVEKLRKTLAVNFWPLHANARASVHVL